MSQLKILWQNMKTHVTNMFLKGSWHQCFSQRVCNHQVRTNVFNWYYSILYSFSYKKIFYVNSFLCTWTLVVFWEENCNKIVNKILNGFEIESKIQSLKVKFLNQSAWEVAT